MSGFESLSLPASSSESAAVSLSIVLNAPASGPDLSPRKKKFFAPALNADLLHELPSVTPGSDNANFRSLAGVVFAGEDFRFAMSSVLPNRPTITSCLQRFPTGCVPDLRLPMGLQAGM